MSLRDAVIIDYLSLRPVVIETPTATYTRHHLMFEDGRARILDGKERVLLSMDGAAVERTGDGQWVLNGEGSTWNIAARKGGCNCQKPAVIEREA